ncbi:MAG: (Fe-S)-binding protein [Acidimicrobiia bacterium]|nr:(Fe-S)-binding protein [Acidimicrobiia bacterium]
MPLPTGDIVGLMVDNLERRSSVFPMSARKATRWARGLGIPDGGETVLYTGAMYQLLPSITAMVRLLERVEDSFLSRFVFLGRWANKVVNLSALAAHPSRADVAHYAGVLRRIARLLQQAGIPFGYLYGDDMYAGALAYDSGVDGGFATHARRVQAMLQRRGVRKLITVDPHTTNMLRSVYPEVLDGWDLEVKSYLEVLAAAGADPLQTVRRDVVIHDSCVYARYEGVIDEPRALLRDAGYRVNEPIFSREQTFCCGGPIEALFPSRAKEIGRRRLEQLQAAGGEGVVTMCPICLAALRTAAEGAIPVEDISLFLAEAYCPASPPRKGAGMPASVATDVG